MSRATLNKVKQSMIAAGFHLFRSIGAHRLAAGWTGGQGAILMLHRVRPWSGGAFAPNRGLEITPEFLDETLTMLKTQGFDIVTLDEAVVRIKNGSRAGRSSGRGGGRRFAVLTFDDAYRDNLEYALPVLRRHNAPFTLYAVPGFASRTAGLWWVELEEAVRTLAQVKVDAGGQSLTLSTSNDSEKTYSFNSLYWLLRSLPEAEMRANIRDLLDRSGGDWRSIVADACMDWDELAAISAEPLCTIGAHTMTHPMLAKVQAAEMYQEMSDSREQLEARLNVKIRHFAYPVGDRGSAGQREFATANELGFETAVTTRPGMVFAEHGDHLHALPRLSVNGNWQDSAALEVLLSGAPFALWNRGRKVNAA